MVEGVENYFFSEYVDLSQITLPGYSDSSPQTDGNQIDKCLNSGNSKQLKDMLRTVNWQMRHPIRKKLWLELCHKMEGEKHIDEYYKNTLKELIGDSVPTTLPPFCDPIYNLTYKLNQKGQEGVEKVLCVLAYSHPSITYCPLLYPLAAIFLHFMSEAEAYYCLCDLLSAKKDEFLTQTKSVHEARAIVAKKLSRKYGKQGYISLEEMKQNYLTALTKSSDEIQKSFERWLCWIFRGLPFHFLVKILDCFFYEGIKVLYRTLLGIVISLTKQPLVLNGNTNSSKVEEKHFSGLSEEIFYFCQNCLGPLDKFMKLCFGIRGLSRKEIRKRIIRAEMFVKSQSVSTTRRVSMGVTTSSDSLYQLYMTSGTLAIRESKCKLSENLKTRSLGMIPLKDFQSSILSPEEMGLIWSWIPARITMLQPHLVYSTNEHGSSLTAFFMRVDQWEPTILVVKALNDQVFGAYCSTSWSVRNLKDESGVQRRYFGTGESFVFTLSPFSSKYAWVGINSKTSVKHSEELFMAADKQWICMGSGNGEALWLHESLSYGRTEPCNTFNNPPLCSEAHFQCKIIEVIAFQ